MQAGHFCIVAVKINKMSLYERYGLLVVLHWQSERLTTEVILGTEQSNLACRQAGRFNVRC